MKAVDTVHTVKKPNNKHPHRWRRADVLEFLAANQDRYDIDNRHINIIEKNEVTGRRLLQLTLQDLRGGSYGITDGAAHEILALVNSLEITECKFVPTT